MTMHTLCCMPTWRTHIILSERWHQQWPGYLLICALTGINDSFSGVKETCLNVFFFLFFFYFLPKGRAVSLSTRFLFCLYTASRECWRYQSSFSYLAKISVCCHSCSPCMKKQLPLTLRICLSWIIHQSKAPTLVLSNLLFYCCFIVSVSAASSRAIVNVNPFLLEVQVSIKLGCLCSRMRRKVWKLVQHDQREPL